MLQIFQGAANETEAESQSVARLEVQALQCTDRMKKGKFRSCVLKCFSNF